jgi:hypothetical protein
MRQALTLLLASGFALQATAGEPARTSTATGKQAIRACSVLTEDLLRNVTPDDQQRFEFGLKMPAHEEPVGASGSMCEYGGVLLQIDPFASPARVEEILAAEWTKVSGLGDVAYFRDNVGEWGELYVRAAGRVFTIQMDIPNGRTAESIRSNAIALAQAILPKLR